MPTATKTWLGGGNNDASNPNDWTPRGAPLHGDNLVIQSGTINVAGHDLAGDTLAVGGDVTINTRANAALDLTDNSGIGTLSVHIKGTLNLTAHGSQLFGKMSFIGGSTKLVGTSSFQGSAVTFDTDLKGNGTIAAGHGGNGVNSGQYEFAGSVGHGVTIVLDGSGPPESVKIDHPSSFEGKIVLPGPGVNPDLAGFYNEPFLGTVLFEGLHITSADLSAHSDVLQMWNGKHLVDTVRLGGDTSNLYVQQTTAGVTLGTTDLQMSNGTPIVGNLFH